MNIFKCDRTAVYWICPHLIISHLAEGEKEAFGWQEVVCETWSKKEDEMVRRGSRLLSRSVCLVKAAGRRRLQAFSANAEAPDSKPLEGPHESPALSVPFLPWKLWWISNGSSAPWHCWLSAITENGGGSSNPCGEWALGIDVILSVKDIVLNKACSMQLYCKKMKKLHLIHASN